MEKRYFGKTPAGNEVYIYTLKSELAEVEIMTHGATVRKMTVYGKSIIGGYDVLEKYIDNGSCQGATIGRVSNRIANAELNLDGKIYQLTKNDGENCLHSGMSFNYNSWDVVEYDERHIVLKRLSPEGECGYPANVTAVAKYTLEGSALLIEYTAVPDGKTPIGMTNHSYFNLDGFGGTVDNHTMRIYAKEYTEVDKNLIPTGNRPSVFGTPFDFFTEPKKIGERYNESFNGYDHNFHLAPVACDVVCGKVLPLVAVANNDSLKLSMYTDQTDVQFYTGNFLEGQPDFDGGKKAILHGGFCLEAQTEPNSANHGVGIYNAGEVYSSTIVYKVDKL